MKKQSATTTEQDRRQLATRREVADFANVHTETVKRWTRDGKLKALRLSSRAVRYRWSDVEALVAQAA